MKASDSCIPQRRQPADGSCPRLVSWNDECKQLKDSLFWRKLYGLTAVALVMVLLTLCELQEGVITWQFAILLHNKKTYYGVQNLLTYIRKVILRNFGVK